MAYSELIKNFNKVRDYMYEFYVYGLKHRNEYDMKSARSYDDVRRRIESWLGEYMSSMQDSSGKNVFLSVDSRTVEQNPFHKAFKAKSFTNKDIMLHFHILDILHDGERLTAAEITDVLTEQLFEFPEELMPDASTVRKKLKEYVELGLLHEEKQGRQKLYSIIRDGLDLSLWKNAIDFFSEATQLGVIGSYLKDKERLAMSENASSVIKFKHHYILEALNSEILYECLLAINESRLLKLRSTAKRRRSEREYIVFPFKIYVSTQSGRAYLCAIDTDRGDINMIRLDHIKQLSRGDIVDKMSEYLAEYEEFTKYLWGVSIGKSLRDLHLEEVEFVVEVLPGQSYIVDRLYREKRICEVERMDTGGGKRAAACYRVSAKLYDAMEMLPWVRTFYGRIREFYCSNEAVERRFFDDMAKMQELYAEPSENSEGGDGHVV